MNRIHALLWCFHSWFWTSKCRLVTQKQQIMWDSLSSLVEKFRFFILSRFHGFLLTTEHQPHKIVKHFDEKLFWAFDDFLGLVLKSLRDNWFLWSSFWQNSEINGFRYFTCSPDKDRDISSPDKGIALMIGRLNDKDIFKKVERGNKMFWNFFFFNVLFIFLINNITDKKRKI